MPQAYPLPGRIVALNVALVLLGKRECQRTRVDVHVRFSVWNVGHRQRAHQRVEVGGVVAAPGLQRLRPAESSGGKIVEIPEKLPAVVAGRRLGEPVGISRVRRQAQAVGVGRQPCIRGAGGAGKKRALLVVVIHEPSVRLVEGVARFPTQAVGSARGCVQVPFVRGVDEHAAVNRGRGARVPVNDFDRGHRLASACDRRQACAAAHADAGLFADHRLENRFGH